MNKNLTPRFIIIAVILAFAIWALLPTLRFQSLDEAEKESLRETGELAELEGKALRQGLDLKGGIYIVLEVNLPTLLENLAVNKDRRFEKALETVQDRLKNDTNLEFFSTFANEADISGLRLLRYYYDLGSNDEEILASLKEEADDAVNRVLEILRNRIDQFGVSEPTIQKQGNRRIIVELAGIQDPQRARALLQSTALLEFFIVKDPEVTQDVLVQMDRILRGSEDLAELTTTEEPEAETIPETEDSPAEDGDEEKPESEDRAISISELFGDDEEQPEDGETAVVDDRLFEDRPFSSLLRDLGRDIGVPEKNLYAVRKILKMEEVQNRLNTLNGTFLFGDEPLTFTGGSGDQEVLYPLYLLEGSPEITGGVVEEAQATIGQQASTVSGQAIVLLSMNSEGSRKWAMVTGSNVGRRIAIVLDRKVHMAPTIQEKISGGGTRIEGFADMNEAKDIAIVLRAGALPAPVNIIEERVVGPSLGSDSVKQGTTSVLIGLGLVLVFMLIYYKLSGLVANFALIWNLILILAVLAALEATLTLPGIAALILTVGMSIDANVIIFERIREELRKGKTSRAAIDSGYTRALTTIIDANITTVIAALVLYQFGTGPIRGFATVLFWGIVISMFTAVFVTRTIFNSFMARRGASGLSI